MQLPLHLWQLIFHFFTQPLPISIKLRANRGLTALSSSLVSTTEHHPLHKRNTIFARQDVQKEDDKKWTLVQILVPIFVGVTAIVVSVVGYTIWYRLQASSRHEFRNRVKRLFTGTQRVQPTERNDSWNIDGAMGYSRGRYQDPLHPNSPYWVSRTAQRVKASVQGSVTTVLRSMPTAPWNQPRQIISQPPSNGFNMDDQDAPSPIRTKVSWWHSLMSNAGPASSGTSSTTSTSSRASASTPIVFGVVQRLDSSFDIVDRSNDQQLTAEEEERESLLPRTPTRSTRRSGSVILISRFGKNFSLRTTTTSSGHRPSPIEAVPPPPNLPLPPRPLPPIPTGTRIPPRPVLPPPLRPEQNCRTLGAFPPPPPAHHRSSSTGSDRLKRKTAMRYAESRHTSTSSISLQIPVLPLESDQLTSLPSPGSPAHSGMATPVAPPSPDRLIEWQASSQEHFYQPFPSRSRSFGSISIEDIRTR